MPEKLLISMADDKMGLLRVEFRDQILKGLGDDNLEIETKGCVWKEVVAK